LGIPSFSTLYKYPPSRLFSFTLVSTPDLKQAQPAPPLKFFCPSVPSTLSRFPGVCRASAAIWTHLECRQISLLSRQSEVSRSTTYSSATTADCSLQSTLSLSPHVVWGRFAYIFLLLHINSWHRQFSLKKILLGFFAI